MPGVCAVLGSSECPGMTRTPSCFHLGACSWSAWLFMRHLLPTSGGACKPLGFFGGTEQRLRLVDALLLLRLEIGVCHDAGARLHVHHPVLDQGRAQDDAAVELACGGEIADRARVEPALVLFELVDDLHGPDLGRTRDGTGGEARGQGGGGSVLAGEVALAIADG